MSFWECALAALFGAIGFLLVYLLKRLTTAAHVRIQFRNANEALVVKIQELVHAQNEVLLLELEVQELVEKAQPEERARWLVRMRDLAHALPPLVLNQVRRFGLAEPPPELPQHSASVAPPPMEQGDDDAQFAQVIQHPSPWTGRVVGQ